MIRYNDNVKLKISEDLIQKSLIEWINYHPKLKEFKDCIIHIPNEGKRSISYGKKLKDMGMRKGVSDLFIAVPKHGYGGAWIELKSYNGKLTKDQEDFMNLMANNNYYTAVCWSIESAMKIISMYFDIKE